MCGLVCDNNHSDVSTHELLAEFSLTWNVQEFAGSHATAQHERADVVLHRLKIAGYGPFRYASGSLSSFAA